MLIQVADIETTEMKPEEGGELIELGVVDCWVNDMGQLQPNTAGRSWLFKPVSGNPAHTRAIHHITDEALQDRPRFNPQAAHTVLGGADYLVAHNAEFEQRWLTHGVIGKAIPWICTMKVARRLWPDAKSFSNGALYYMLADQGLIFLPEALRFPPHRALPDARITALIFGVQMTMATLEEMALWTNEPSPLRTCPIGEHKGKTWDEVPWGFLDWMVNKAQQLDADARWNAKRELDRRAAL